MKASVLLTVLTSASASLCCIVPVFGLIGGSSSLITAVSWFEPFRPYFIGATFLMLGLAWYSSIISHKKDDCGCETEKPSFIRSKKFLSIVTIVSLVLISFPSFSRFLFPSNDDASSIVDQERNKKITLGVNGMTCASCEHHIESEVIKLSGVSSVKASYSGKSTTVEYNPEKVDEEKIISAINSTGYKVEQDVNPMQEKPKTDCCTKEVFHLSEHHGDSTPGWKAYITVDDVRSFYKEIREKKYKFNNPGLEMAPWNAPCFEVIDPFGINY